MFQGKAVLITGSTSGIGLGIAKAFAHAGADIMLNGLGDRDEIEALRADLAQSAGVTVAFHGADMRRGDEIKDLVHETHQRFNSLDILVNNAGIQHVAPIDEFPEERWNAIMDIILNSAFHTIRHTLPLMKTQGWGRIINIGSAHALVASPYKSAYVAAKHGIAGLTKAVALEVATQGITVNAISPGYVLTRLVEQQIPDTAKARGIREEEVKRDVLLAAQPTKDFVRVEDIGAFAKFLASSEAASINGAILSMDGGWTAQ